jgi:hypothetical protein
VATSRASSFTTGSSEALRWPCHSPYSSRCSPGELARRRPESIAASRHGRALGYDRPRAQICAVLADAANRAFDLLEPAIGRYGIRTQPGSIGPRSDTGQASGIGRPGSIGQRDSR